MGLHDRVLLATGRSDMGFQRRWSVVKKEAVGCGDGSIDQCDLWVYEMECLETVTETVYRTSGNHDIGGSLYKQYMTHNESTAQYRQ